MAARRSTQRRPGRVGAAAMRRSRPVWRTAWPSRPQSRPPPAHRFRVSHPQFRPAATAPPPRQPAPAGRSVSVTGSISRRKGCVPWRECRYGCPRSLRSGVPPEGSPRTEQVEAFVMARIRPAASRHGFPVSDALVLSALPKIEMASLKSRRANHFTGTALNFVAQHSAICFTRFPKSVSPAR